MSAPACATVRALVALPADPYEQTALVERLRRADIDAVAEVYDRHQAAVHAFARRLVGDADSAQDLVQEVFLALPKAMKRFQGQASLKTFLLSIAINHARHHVRAAARRRKAFERFATEPQNDSTLPDEASERRRLAEELSRALDKLPLDQRIAFVLCEVEERTSREVAEITGAKEATIRTRLFHAKRKLREELEKRGLR